MDDRRSRVRRQSKPFPSFTTRNYFVAHSIPFESSRFFEIHAMSTTAMVEAISKVVPPPCLTTAQWQSELRSIYDKAVPRVFANSAIDSG